MKIKNLLPLQRLIAKIDNDFNISESDWIPRVAAWVTDALSQMQILAMEKKKRTLEVSERVAQFPCRINATNLKVYDSNGNEIQNLDDNDKGSCCGKIATNISSTGGQIGVFDVTAKTVVVADVVGGCGCAAANSGKNFVLDCDKIELNFDADSITVESYETATYYDDYYECNVPYVYDDGLLLEALAWYCLFKYLSRGSTHQVYSLKTNVATLNPLLQWNYYRPKAIASVKKKISKGHDDGWNNFFYNSTFLPRG